MGRPVVDLVGLVFERLTVVKLDHVARRGAMWRCSCACGNISVVGSGALRSGKTLSCGCFRSEMARARVTTHGGTDSHAFTVWRGMRERCGLQSHKSFADYGGRGIQVCERWANSFELFLADMGPPPDHRHSIEREDVNGNYEPTNCTWATTVMQSRNRRSNVFYEFHGRRLILKDLAKLSGVPEQTLYNRFRRGLSIEDATFQGRLPRR